MNNSYHTLLAFFDRASEDSSDFINGNDHPFESSLIETDKIYSKLVQPCDAIDDNVCALAQMAFKRLGGVLRKAMKEQLPGGNFFQPTDEIREHTQLYHTTKFFNMFLEYLTPLFVTDQMPSPSLMMPFLMFAFNKTSEWLDTSNNGKRKNAN
ncbi:hypothetical protein ACJMK2_041568 [Sinanodonta woodiana]|uniref:Uncharacterized protein n=1 Tax=Sinanodonta woodiana TaxID=1069815 RepID=A0ABD3W4L2_SINWO